MQNMDDIIDKAANFLETCYSLHSYAETEEERQAYVQRIKNLKRDSIDDDKKLLSLLETFFYRGECSRSREHEADE